MIFQTGIRKWKENLVRNRELQLSKDHISGNLFTDMYSVRESLYGSDATTRINEVRREVEDDIANDRAPQHLRYVLLKTTNYCNSDCEYCSHAINRVPREEKFSIPSDIIMNTIEDAAKLGVEAMSISGGEPLLRNDIFDVIKKAVDCGIVPVLLTNGLLLPEKWEQLGEAGLRYIIISFDSVVKEVYEKQRGADFDKAIKGIEAAIKLRDKYEGVEIHVSTVLTKDNQDDFLMLLDYMNERRIKVQINPYHKRENDKDDYSIVEYEKIKKLSDRLVRMKREGWCIANSVGFLEHLPDYFCSGKVMPDNFKCKVGYTNLVVDTYMNVKPCWSSMFKPMGNLKEKGLIEIWSSEEMQRNRHRMLECKCEGCWYICTSEICMMLDNMLY